MKREKEREIERKRKRERAGGVTKKLKSVFFTLHHRRRKTKKLRNLFSLPDLPRPRAHRHELLRRGGVDSNGPVEVGLTRATPHGDGDALHDLGSVGADLVFFSDVFFCLRVRKNPEKNPGKNGII
jgi:hypothetical protein